MSDTTITYRYLVPDEGPTAATWTGDRDEAIDAAADALNAWPVGDAYAYHPEELAEELNGRPIVVTDDSMVELGAGLCAGHELDALYDPWCAGTAAVPFEAKQKRLVVFWTGLADHVEELSDEELLADLEALGITGETVARLRDSVLAMVKRAKERAGS